MEMQRLCPACFSLLENGESICPECGARHDARNPEQLLPIGTMLNDRFRVGRVLSHNDLLTSYLAWDTQKERKVRVEEFFPGILKRGEDGKGIVLISAESKTLFRTMASDLHDRWKRLMGINHKAMLKTVVLFSENDTLYRVTEYLKMTALEDYLKDRSEPMALSDVRILMSPLISLLSQLHNMGLTHCGISPQNIYVDFRKRVVLDGFALPEVRTVGNSLKAELYAGYSAPEQYSKALWQGEWTDIYAMGAVLYRIFAGQDPVSAEFRAEQDMLAPLSTMRADLPANVTEAVMKAMAYDHKQRFRTVELLSAALLEEAGANTAVFRPDQATREFPRQTAAAAAGTPAADGMASRMQVILAVLLAISIAGNIFLALWQGGQKKDPAYTAPVMERDLAGYYLPAIQEELEMMSGYQFSYRYEYNGTYPEGVIYKQSLSVGQVLPEDGSVTLYVSKGVEWITMPDLIGANEAYAMRVLTEKQIQYTIEYDTDPETGGEIGTVLSTSIGPGEHVTPRTGRVPSNVVVIVKGDPYGGW